MTVLQSFANQITFGALPVKAYGDGDFEISAASTSGLPVRFVSGDNNIATVTQDASGNWTVHIVAAGTVAIESFQDGNGDYAAASEVDETLQVNKAGQTITFPALPQDATTTGTLRLAATASSGMDVTYTVSNPAMATVTGNELLFTGTGQLTVTATQPGNNDYNAAAPVRLHTECLQQRLLYGRHWGVPQPGARHRAYTL